MFNEKKNVRIMISILVGIILIALMITLGVVNTRRHYAHADTEVEETTLVVITDPEETTVMETTSTTTTDITTMSTTTTDMTTVEETITSAATSDEIEESTVPVTDVIAEQPGVHVEVVNPVMALEVSYTEPITFETVVATEKTTSDVTTITEVTTTKTTTTVVTTEEMTTETTTNPNETYLGNFRITGYVATGSKTASGAWPSAGKTIAMNKTQMNNLGLKYGDQIRIDGLGTYTLEDCGCKSGRIDVFCSSVSACYALPSYCDAYLVTE